MIEKNSVAAHYDGSAENYHLQYDKDLLSDITREYPANYFRMHLLMNSFVESNLNRVVEIGVGVLSEEPEQRARGLYDYHPVVRHRCC